VRSLKASNSLFALSAVYHSQRSDMQQQPLKSDPCAAPFTLLPFGAGQFYQMAQQQTETNSLFAPPSGCMPYAPLPEHEIYVSTMNVPVFTPVMPVHNAGQAAHGAEHCSESLYPILSESWYYQQQQQHQQHQHQAAMASPHAGIQHQRQHQHQHQQPHEYAAPSAQLYESAFGPVMHRMSTPLSAAAPAPVKQEAYQYQSLMMPVPAPVHTSVASTLASEVEKISDDPLTDEHKWRKYGQKQVKNSAYPRNYYKCTVQACPAKKHVEKFLDASSNNKERLRTLYIGEHEHPTPCSPHVHVHSQQDFLTSVLVQSTKMRLAAADASLSTPASPSSHPSSARSLDQRLVVECLSPVDENEDGYFWRKYGQKTVRGSSAPRLYFRCRHEDCPVKKQVESTAQGNTIVTYEGAHNHEAGMCTEKTAPVISDSFPPTSSARLPYPAADSPSSSFSTTEDDYSSTPSPKRSKFVEEAEDADAIHQLALYTGIDQSAQQQSVWSRFDWDAQEQVHAHASHADFLDLCVD
jgi:hypothetical protein